MRVCLDFWSERDVQKLRDTLCKNLLCKRFLLLRILELHCFCRLLCSWRMIQLHFILQGFIIKWIYLLGISESLPLQCVYHADSAAPSSLSFNCAPTQVLLDLYKRAASRYVCTFKKKKKKHNPLRFHGFHKAAAAFVTYLQSSRKWLRLLLVQRYTSNIWESVCVRNILADISASASENPTNSKAPGDTARWESLGLLLPLAVWTMWSRNAVCPEPLPLADVHWDSTQRPCFVPFARYFVQQLWKVASKCFESLSIWRDAGHILVLHLWCFLRLSFEILILSR